MSYKYRQGNEHLFMLELEQWLETNKRNGTTENEGDKPNLQQSSSPDSTTSSSSLFNNIPPSDCSCESESCEFCNVVKFRAPARMDTATESPSTISTTQSPSTISTDKSSPSDSSNTCEIHTTHLELYCLTCNVPICEDCSTPYHDTHSIAPLNAGREASLRESNNVLIEITNGIQFIDRDLQAITAEYALLETKTRDAVDDLNRCWFLLKTAMDNRRQSLLMEMERAKIYRWDALREREEGLKNCRRKLKDLISKQHLAIKSTNVTNNPYHLNIANGRAFGVAFEVEEHRKQLTKLNDNWIGFSASERPLVESISVLGSVILKNPGLIGDGRIIRQRSPQIFVPTRRLPLSVMPCGRPVASVSRPVIVWPQTLECTLLHLPPTRIVGKQFQKAEHPDNLCRPWGIACDREGNIYVADRSNNRIVIFSENGSIIRKIGSYGTGPEQFNRPAGITIDERRRIIVADKDNHRIQILTMAGTFLLDFGKKGSECGQFNYPWDVAANTVCEILVSDTRNHRIQLFSPEGIFLRKFGYDATFGAFKVLDSPRGVAFTPEGNVVLTDFNAHRILHIDYKFANSKVFECKTRMRTVVNFQRPQGIIVDDVGNFVVSDSKNYRVLIFNKFGILLYEYGKQGEDINEMDRPSGVALLPNGKIAVVDFGNNRVLIR